jgi:hypothetical protein
MALVISDRVKETTITTGTGSITLTGTIGGFQSFLAAIGDGNQTYYTIENDSKWEVGIGTYASADNTLSRDTVLASSNSDAKISLNGVSFAFCTLPADRALFKDVDNVLDLSTGDVKIDDLYASDIVSSGTIGCSGLLTLRRESAGNFFNAYVDDSYDRTISLYSDATSSVEWRLGLQNSPLDSGSIPSYAYVFGEDGNIGLVANSLNSIELSHGGGLILANKGSNIFRVSSTTGVYINSVADAYPALTVNGGVSLSSDIQRWQTSAGTVLSVITKDGNLGIGTDSPTYELDVEGDIGLNQYIYHNGDTNTYIRFRTDQIDFVAGGRTMLTIDEASNDKVIVNNGKNDVDFQVEGDGDQYLIYTDAANDRVGIGTNEPAYKLDVVGTGRMSSAIFAGDSTEQTTAFSSSYISNISTNTSNISNHATAIVANSASGVAISGWAKAYVDTQDHSVAAVSGWADSTFIDAGTIPAQILANSASGVAISGWAKSYIDTQDHSATSVSGWASGTFMETTSTFFHDKTNEVLAINTANPTTSAGGSPYYKTGLDVNGHAFVSGQLAAGSIAVENILGGSDGNISCSGLYVSSAGNSSWATIDNLIVLKEADIRGANTLKFVAMSGLSGVIDHLRFDPSGQQQIRIGESVGSGVGYQSTAIGSFAGSGASGNYQTSMLGFQAGMNALNSSYSNFIGIDVGKDSSGVTHSNLIGSGVGVQSSGYEYTNVIGHGAGEQTSGINNTSIIGNKAAIFVTGVDNSNIIGTSGAAYSSGINYSNIIGYQAGSYASGNSYSNIIGYQAGYSGGFNPSNVIGFQAGYKASGSYSNMMGSSAGAESSGSYNQYFGTNAGYSTSGNNNIEIVTSGSIPSLLHSGQSPTSDKVNIGSTIVGDLASKKIAIGFVSGIDLDPDSTLQVLPSAITDVGLSVRGNQGQLANLFEAHSGDSTVLMSIDPSGSIYSSGTISASGGVLFKDLVPNDTSLKLYNDGGKLKFSGSDIDAGASGWAKTYIDEQDHSAVAVSGWASGTFMETTPTFFYDKTDTVLAVNTANPTTTAGGSPYHKTGLDVNGHAWVSGQFSAGSIVVSNTLGGSDGNISCSGLTVSSAGNSSYATVDNLVVLKHADIRGSETLQFVKMSGVSGVMDQLVFQNERPADQAIITRNHVTQTANLFETQDANSGVLMNIDPSGSVFSSGTVSASGGVLFNDVVPNDTSLKLYNDGGILKFNSSGVDALASGLVISSGNQLIDRVRLNSASGVAISGWASSTVAATGATNAASASTNAASIISSGNHLLERVRLNSASGVAISGWADSTFVKTDSDTTYTASSGVHLVGTDFRTSGVGIFNVIEFGEDAGSATAPIRIGNSTTGSDYSVAIGYKALEGISATSTVNIGVGHQAGDGLEEASVNNVMIGGSAGAAASGDRNIILGTLCGSAQKGDDNLTLGFGAGYQAAGDKNIYIGYWAGRNVNPGSNNIDITIDPDGLEHMDGLSSKLNIYNIIRGDASTNRIAIGGNLAAADYTPDATLEVKPKEATDVGIIVQADAAHTANFMEFQNSSEFVLAKVTADGSIATSGTISASGGIMLTGETSAYSAIVWGTGAGDGSVRIGSTNAGVMGGTRNISIGQFSGAGVYGGEDNIGLGRYAGYGNRGDSNISIGYWSGYNNDSSYNNNIGFKAGYEMNASQVGSDHNNSMGYEAAYYASGDYNVSIGYQAGYVASGDKSILIGYNAGKDCVGDYNIELVTNGASTSILNGLSSKINIDSTIIGDTSAKKLAVGNVGVGDVVPDATLEVKPKEATDVGIIVQGDAAHSANLTEWQDSSEFVFAKVTADGSIASSGTVGASGGMVIASTNQLKWVADDGDDNGVRIGQDAGVMGGLRNVSIGQYAGNGSNGGDYNIGIGRYSCGGAAGDYNVGIGYMAGHSTNSSTDYNIAVGYTAGKDLTGDDNVSLGHYAGRDANGDKNIYIGYGAGYQVDTGSNNIEILTSGTVDGPSDLDGLNNKINIENLIHADAATQKLALGHVVIGDFSPSATLEIKPKEITDTALSIQSSGISDVVKVYGNNVAVSGRLLGPISAPLLQDTNATVNVDLGSGNYYEVELAAAVTKVIFKEGSAGQKFVVRFSQPAGANYTIAWTNVDVDDGGTGGTVSWAAGGTAPTMTATNAKADTYGFIQRSATAFDGFVIGQNI